MTLSRWSLPKYSARYPRMPEAAKGSKTIGASAEVHWLRGHQHPHSRRNGNHVAALTNLRRSLPVKARAEFRECYSFDERKRSRSLIMIPQSPRRGWAPGVGGHPHDGPRERDACAPAAALHEELQRARCGRGHRLITQYAIVSMETICLQSSVSLPLWCQTLCQHAVNTAAVLFRRLDRGWRSSGSPLVRDDLF
jgi:hypothetical protein